MRKLYANELIYDYTDANITEGYLNGNLGIIELFLSTRAYNCLTENGILTINQLEQISDNDLLQLGKLGTGSLNEIKCKIAILKRNVKRYFDDEGKGDAWFLKKHFDLIQDSVKNRKLKPFINAYTEEPESLEILYRLLKAEYIYQIEDLILSLEMNEREAITVKCFMIYLSTDINEIIKDAFAKIFRTERSKIILGQRAEGKSLEEIGRSSGITRERVRQLEEMMFHDFNVCNKRKRLLQLFAAMSDNTEIALESMISKLVSAYEKELIYILRNTIAAPVSYNKKYQVYCLEKNYNFDKIEEYMSNIQPFFKKNEFEQVVETAAGSLDIPYILAQRAIEKNFTASDSVYCNVKIGLGDKYGIVLKTFYPTGIKLFDKKESLLFRKRVTELFGNIKLPQSDKAIDSRLVEIGILCDRGMYIHPDYIDIPSDLISKIDSYIASNDRIAMSYLEIYEYFKDELTARSSVSNRYYLQGVLRYFLGDRYYFTRDLISKDKSIDFLYELREFVRERGEVSKSELKSNFLGVSDAMLAQTISRCKDILIVDYNTYQYADKLNIHSEDYTFLKEKLDEVLANGLPISCRKLYSILRKEPLFVEFTKRNNIVNYARLYGVLKFMFDHDYVFSRPNIALKGTDDPCNLTIVKRYLQGKKIIKIDEMFKFCEENQIKFVKKSVLLKRLSDEYYRVDVNELVPVSELDLTDDKITAIKLEVLNILEKQKYVALMGMKDFSRFPDIGVPWTPFLLISLAQNYMHFLSIVEIPSRSYDFPNCIFVRTDNQYAEDYKEIVRWILKLRHEMQPFKTLGEVKNWLIDEGVVIKSIPIYLTARKLLYTDENGKVVIK